MKAEKRGTSVVVTLTEREARDLEDELLWCRDDAQHSKALWETLATLSETQET